MPEELSKPNPPVKPIPPVKQSPLQQIDFGKIAAAREALEIRELAFCGHINLRGSTADQAFMSAAQSVLGAALPTASNTMVSSGDYTVLWYGPDEWLILTAPGNASVLEAGMRDALQDVTSAVTDISGGNTVLEIKGSAATDLLVKGCPLDLHASVFGIGQCAQTLLAKTNITLFKVQDAHYRVIVRRSFADYLGLWLLDAAREFAAPAV